MQRPPLRCLLTLLFLHPLVSSAQTYLPLDFSNTVQPNNDKYPNDSTLGPDFYNGNTLDFLNVTSQDGRTIDARVNILGTAGNYFFEGWIPNYNSANGQPEGDLGVYYAHDGVFTAPTGGISYSLSFYEGGGTFTNAAVLSDFRILIYDHDGEPGQSESIRIHEADGFTGYQIRDGSGIHSHNEGGTWRFDAAGKNLSETIPDGGFIAYYQNTSSIRFDLFATTLPSNPTQNDGVFTAFDGDLGLTGGSTDNFSAFIPVPEPSTSCLVASALCMMLTRRKRSSAGSNTPTEP